MNRFLAKSRQFVPYLLSILCTYLALLGTLSIGKGMAPASHSAVWILAFALLVAGSVRFWQERDTRLKVCSLVFGVAFALSFAVGYQLEVSGTLGGWADVTIVLGTAFCLAPAMAYGWICLYRLSIRIGGHPAGVRGSGKRAFWFYAAFISVCWIPVFLAFYPGIYTYDSYIQIKPAIDGLYTTAHPIFHTWVMSAFYWIGGQWGSYTAGIAVYTVFQMLLIALALAYAVAYLHRNGCPRVIRVTALLFFALCPICPMLSISATKDALFAAGVLLLSVCAHDVYQRPEQLGCVKHWLRFMGIAALMCLLRNNGVLLVGALLVASFLLFRKRPKLCLRICAALVCGVLLFAGTTLALVAILQASPGPFSEALSVPMQQVAMAWNRHKAEIENNWDVPLYIPTVEYYRPHLADWVKYHNNVGVGNGMEFAAIWADLLLRYPIDYADAFLMTNQGLWFMDDLSYSQVYSTEQEGGYGYILAYHYPEGDVEEASCFPALKAFYLRLFSNNGFQQVPLLAILFSPAFYTWFICFFGLAAIYSKRRDILMFAMGPFCLLASLLLAPCALIRYSFPLVLACPILFGLMFGKQPSAGSAVAEAALP